MGDVVTVWTDPNLQVPGFFLLVPGSEATAVPAVFKPGPDLPPLESTLQQGQWIMDPNNEYVLILGGTGPDSSLALYQVVGSTRPQDGQFNGLLRWSPAVGPVTGKQRFCAQTNGYVALYGEDDNVLWSEGKESPTQYFVVQTNGLIGLGYLSLQWAVS